MNASTAASVRTDSPELPTKMSASRSGKRVAPRTRRPFAPQISTGTPQDLSASRLWEVNEIDGTAFTSDGFFSKIGGEYFYELRGKNGEPRIDKPVTFTVNRRGFSRPQTINLKTDAKGRVQLGNLAGISGVNAVAPNGRESTLTPRDYDRAWDETIHIGAGQPARIPAPPAP